MKAFGLLFLLVPTVCFASVDTSVYISTETKYECKKLSDNEVDAAAQFLTDNQPIDMTTTILQNDKEFIVKPNGAIREEKTFTNEVGGSISGFAGTSRAIIFKHDDNDGKPYFMMFLYATKDDPDADLHRGVVFFDCERK